MTDESVIITHHNKTFKNEFVTLNDNTFVQCVFDNCQLNMVDVEHSVVRLIACYFKKDCTLVGAGWPYELAERWDHYLSTGEPINWQGNIGNKDKTRH